MGGATLKFLLLARLSLVNGVSQLLLALLSRAEGVSQYPEKPGGAPGWPSTFNQPPK